MKQGVLDGSTVLKDNGSEILDIKSCILSKEQCVAQIKFLPKQCQVSDVSAKSSV